MTEIDSMERDIANGEAAVALRDRIQRLQANPDFKDLIMDGFCLNEAAKLVQASVSVKLSKDQRADALSMAQSSGHLVAYMDMIETRGNHFEQKLPAMREELEVMRSEA